MLALSGVCEDQEISLVFITHGTETAGLMLSFWWPPELGVIL